MLKRVHVVPNLRTHYSTPIDSRLFPKLRRNIFVIFIVVRMSEMDYSKTNVEQTSSTRKCVELICDVILRMHFDTRYIARQIVCKLKSAYLKDLNIISCFA